MAAIKPHLEQQNDPSETPAERKYFAKETFEEKVEDGTAIVGLSGVSGQYPITAKEWGDLQGSHAELLRLGFSRQVTNEQLKDRSITVTGTLTQAGVGEVFLTLDKAVAGAEWNAAGARNIRNIRLLSWTKKMGTPSFALPAGATQLGGSCPGAVGGQSTVPMDEMKEAQENVTAVTGRPVSVSDAVCERCYATGGNYLYGSNVLAQTVRWAWVKAALKNGTFVDVMSWAVEHADYMLDGGTVKGESKEEKAVSYGPERFPGRYFRIHDSGDFYKESYLKAWKEVANRFKDGPNRITFWAPTRIWATPWGVEAVNRINGDPDSNLIIRPSIYHINEEIPATDLGPGWANWSLVFSPGVKTRLAVFQPNDPGGAGLAEPGPDAQSGAPFDWDCQAYAVKNEAHSCRNARGPQDTGAGDHGDMGCRVCWVQPETSINYTEH